ncbi:MAG: long-chain fatty acid--CoA ligase [Frankia sp.]
MLSTMQDGQLGIRRLLEAGSGFFGSATVTTALAASPEVTLETVSYAQVGENVARLAHALAGLGVEPGDRVATFMWNNRAHLEAYYAAPCMGAVIHPLNIRLLGEQVTFIANHAEDKILIADASLLGLLRPLLPAMKTVEHLIVVGAAPLDEIRAEQLSSGRAGLAVHDYDALLAAGETEYPWPELDEHQAAAMCYTSGTTGDPKGVLYSHRSIVLHALSICLPGAFGLSSDDRMLLVVPQFHVMAWGIPYVAFLSGTSMVMPGPFLPAASLAAVIAAARPTKAAGVPTIWQALLTHLDAHPEIDVSCLREAIVGGSACPPSLLDAYAERLGIALVHAWGMTEMSPLGTVSRVPAEMTGEPARRRLLSQGRFSPLVEARIVGPDGTALPTDGQSTGEVEVRGPWIAASYYSGGGGTGQPCGTNGTGQADGIGRPTGRADAEDKFRDGWLRTGDVGAITSDGFLTLTDRLKDVIKSGGEWISSVELENELMAHPCVREAAVIGVPDESWGERPLACTVLTPDARVSPADLRAHLAGRVARWQVPERWAFVDEVPKTSVGKFDKKLLRQRHADGDLVVTVAAD